MSAVQYLTDSQGIKTSVVISIQDWRNLSKFIKEIQALEQVVESVKEGIAQAKQIEAGEIQHTESTEEFLNGL
ncbi:MAG: hypothetical protein AAFZ63_25895 [Bacteroidota bacterium]